METHDLFEEALAKLIEANRLFRQELFNEDASEYRKAEFAMHFCTIRCDIGRMTGKTTLIGKWLKESSAIAVVDTKDHKGPYPKETWGRIFSTRQVIDGACKKIAYTTVFVDDASFILKNDELEQAIFAQLAINNDIIFVLLG